MDLIDKITTVNSRKHISLFSLLLACVIFIFVLPLLAIHVNWFGLIVLSSIIFLAASTLSARVIVFAFVAVAIEWITKASDFIYMHYLAEITTNLFIVGIVVSLVSQIMNRKNVTILTLVEALNGYLLLGIMFTSLAAFVHLHRPGSFSGDIISELGLTYYAFITLTTTGYGDIVPQTPIAKSLALLIAISGQFYVAVIVAILVGKYSNKQHSEEVS